MFDTLKQSIKQKLSNRSRGQMNLVGLVVAVIVVFITLSLGIVLTNNFYIATGQTPAFNSMWPLILAAVAMIVVLLVGLGGVVHGG